MARIITPRNSLVRPRGVRKPAQFFLDSQHPLSRGLVGFWPLGDTNAGLTKDASWYNNNAIFSVSLPTLGSSHHGGAAIVLSGSNQLVQAPYSAAAFGSFSGAAPITMAIWIKWVASTTSYNSLISNADDSSGNGFEFLLRSDQKIAVYFAGATPFHMDGTGGTVSFGAWHHIVATFDGAAIVTYIDGKLDISTTVTGNYGNVGRPYTFGASFNNPSYGRFINGSLEGARIYNRALSATEIAWLYAEPYAGLYSATGYGAGALAPYLPPPNKPPGKGKGKGPHGNGPPGHNSKDKPKNYSAASTGEAATRYRRERAPVLARRHAFVAPIILTALFSMIGVKVKARAAPVSSLVLSSRVTGQVKAKAGRSIFQFLTTRIVAMAKARALQVARSPLSSHNTLQIKARSEAMLRTRLATRSVIQVKSRTVMMPKALLRAAASIKTFLRVLFQPEGCNVYSVGAIYPFASSIGAINNSLASIAPIDNPVVSSQAAMCCGSVSSVPVPPVVTSDRITEAGDRRITMAGDVRITQP